MARAKKEEKKFKYVVSLGWSENFNFVFDNIENATALYNILVKSWQVNENSWYADQSIEDRLDFDIMRLEKFEEKFFKSEKESEDE